MKPLLIWGQLLFELEMILLTCLCFHVPLHCTSTWFVIPTSQPWYDHSNHCILYLCPRELAPLSSWPMVWMFSLSKRSYRARDKCTPRQRSRMWMRSRRSPGLVVVAKPSWGLATLGTTICNMDREMYCRSLWNT